MRKLCMKGESVGRVSLCIFLCVFACSFVCVCVVRFCVRVCMCTCIFVLLHVHDDSISFSVVAGGL